MANVPIIVLDINGVLADVRRREAPPVTDRAPDVVLPNRQKAYLHPNCKTFLEWLAASQQHVGVVMFTSRTCKNAACLEEILSALCPALRPIAVLHGEDCKGKMCPGESWHPMKSASAVYDACSRNARAPTKMLFVDDHPERINLDSDGCKTLRVPTYNALTTTALDAEKQMKDTMWSIYDECLEPRR